MVSILNKRLKLFLWELCNQCAVQVPSFEPACKPTQSLLWHVIAESKLNEREWTHTRTHTDLFATNTDLKYCNWQVACNREKRKCRFSYASNKSTNWEKVYFLIIWLKSGFVWTILTYLVHKILVTWGRLASVCISNLWYRIEKYTSTLLPL